MAVLEKALTEEYERVRLRLQQIDLELDTLPKGYISEKTIKDKTYCYLQRREKTKIVSEYIKADEVAQMRRVIAYRKELEGERKDTLKEFDRIRKILGIYTEGEKLEKLMIGLEQAKNGEGVLAEDFFRGILNSKSGMEKI